LSVGEVKAMDNDATDFAAALRGAGLTVPAERYAAMLDAYRSMRALLAVLDEPLAYADEPAVLPRPEPTP
jgi:hypothetical protein